MSGDSELTFPKAVIFQIHYVGTDQGAQDYIEELQEECGDILFCNTEPLDNIMEGTTREERNKDVSSCHIWYAFFRLLPLTHDSCLIWPTRRSWRLPRKGGRGNVLHDDRIFDTCDVAADGMATCLMRFEGNDDCDEYMNTMLQQNFSQQSLLIST